MKNNKGFTLVELLAVVALMAILLVIAGPAVLSFTTRMKSDMFCSKVDTVVKSAQMYGQDSMSSLAYDRLANECYFKQNASAVQETVPHCVRTDVQVLLAKGYLSKEARKKKKNEATDPVPDDFFDPRDGRSLKTSNVYVYVINKRAYAAYVFENKRDADLCKGVYYKDGANVYLR